VAEEDIDGLHDVPIVLIVLEELQERIEQVVAQQQIGVVRFLLSRFLHPLYLLFRFFVVGVDFVVGHGGFEEVLQVEKDQSDDGGGRGVVFVAGLHVEAAVHLVSFLAFLDPLRAVHPRMVARILGPLLLRKECLVQLPAQTLVFDVVQHESEHLEQLVGELFSGIDPIGQLLHNLLPYVELVLVAVVKFVLLLHLEAHLAHIRQRDRQHVVEEEELVHEHLLHLRVLPLQRLEDLLLIHVLADPFHDLGHDLRRRQQLVPLLAVWNHTGPTSLQVLIVVGGSQQHLRDKMEELDVAALVDLLKLKLQQALQQVPQVFSAFFSFGVNGDPEHVPEVGVDALVHVGARRQPS